MEDHTHIETPHGQAPEDQWISEHTDGIYVCGVPECPDILTRRRYRLGVARRHVRLSHPDFLKEGHSRIPSVSKTQTALVRRYDFDDEDEQRLAVALRKAADFVEQYDGGVMDITLTMDTDGPVVSLFTEVLPDTEGALIEQAGVVEALLFKVAQRLASQPDLRERVLAERQRLTTAAMLAKEARRE